VAYEVCRALKAPLDVLIVRKLGAPGQPELGIGAVVDGESTQVVLDDEAVRTLQVTPAYLEREIAQQRAELQRRQDLYRRGRSALAWRGRTIILVDDGIATGVSVRAALRAVRAAQVARIVLAVPVAAAETMASLQPEVDRAVCLATPHHFRAVGQYYDDFRQTSDAEVIELLEDAAARVASGGPVT